MIDIKELGPNDIGKWVEYRAGTGETERGRIKSWTDKCVHVVYKCDNQWQRFEDFTGCLTDPSDLTLLPWSFVPGHVVSGCGHFGQRMTKYRDVFTDAAGEELQPGTLNVKIDWEIQIKEEFRIPGAKIGERWQDLLFEECLINGIKAFRIRPFVLETGGGGHGDDTLEIASASWIPNAELGSKVEVTFFRDLT